MNETPRSQANNLTRALAFSVLATTATPNTGCAYNTSTWHEGVSHRAERDGVSKEDVAAHSGAVSMRGRETQFLCIEKDNPRKSEDGHDKAMECTAETSTGYSVEFECGDRPLDVADCYEVAEEIMKRYWFKRRG